MDVEWKATLNDRINILGGGFTTSSLSCLASTSLLASKKHSFVRGSPKIQEHIIHYIHSTQYSTTTNLSFEHILHNYKQILHKFRTDITPEIHCITTIDSEKLQDFLE